MSHEIIFHIPTFCSFNPDKHRSGRSGMDGPKLTFRRKPRLLGPISPDPDPRNLSLLLTNRCLVHLSRNELTSAIRDAHSAVCFDPTNTIALLQRANANYLLGHYLEASEDYSRLVDRDPTYTALFNSRTSASSSLTALVDLVAAIPIPALLPGGLALDLYTESDARALMYEMRSGTLPPAPFISSLLERTRVLHTSFPNVVDIHVKEIKIVGDTHGQFQDLIFIFETFGFPSESIPYLFNGDFVDRGSQGLEIVIALLAWKIANPTAIYLNRGNQFILFSNLTVNRMQ
jgi:serine/threonine-protein phosphatase 5